MFLITGAAGAIGKEIVEQLLADGAAVRLLTHDPDTVAGWGDRVEVAQGELSRPETIRAALEGIDAVLLAAGGDRAGQSGPIAGVLSESEAELANYIMAARAQGSPRTVLLSVLAASGPGVELADRHARRETLLQASGLPLTILRLGMVMLSTGSWARSILAEGLVYNPHGQGLAAPIAPEDIAAVAIQALRRADLAGQTLELTGPELLSTPQQVEILARVLDQPLQTVEIPVTLATQRMQAAGVPEPMARALGELMERVRSGQSARRTDTVSQVTGLRPFSFEDWAREHAELWL